MWLTIALVVLAFALLLYVHRGRKGPPSDDGGSWMGMDFGLSALVQAWRKR